MPLYTYQLLNPDGSGGELVTLEHGMNEPPFTEHPETGQPVQRVFAAPHVAGWGSERKSKELVSDENVGRLGFTKYVRNGKGHYEKRTGRGPNQLNIAD